MKKKQKSSGTTTVSQVSNITRDTVLVDDTSASASLAEASPTSGSINKSVPLPQRQYTPTTGHGSSANYRGLPLQPQVTSSLPPGRPRYRRRPDRHPFVVDVPGSLFFATRAMPQPNTRYSVVVGESFWRLATYIDSVPSRREERISGRFPHVLLTGPAGCGKSFLMAATSALLGFGPASLRPDEYGKYLSADYRCIYLGDCRRWCEAEDPLTYFRMELLRGLRDVTAPQDTDDHHAPEHLGCLLCVEPFTHIEQVKAFLDKCCRWVEEFQPDTLLVFFLDQAEELVGRKTANCIPLQIVQILLAAELPLLVWSVRSPGNEASFPWRSSCGLVLSLPYRTNWEEFTKHLELHSHSLSAGDGKLTASWGRDPMISREIRFWTGSVPIEITEFFGLTVGGSSHVLNSSIFARLNLYRQSVANRIKSLFLSQIAKLDGKQRNILLIVLFAIILRVPMDMSGEFNIGNILALGPSITSYLLLHSRQSFYHTTDGIITLADVPAALTPALHIALTSVTSLSTILRNWVTLFENVVQAMILSKLLCPEAKRRMTRFYAHAKLLWSSPPSSPSGGPIEGWNLIGAISETGESLRIKFSRPRIVVFAGHVPLNHCFTDVNEHYGSATTDNGSIDFDSIVFIPGRTAYWFFDLFVYLPGERRLYAVTTSAIVGMWLKDLQSTTGGASGLRLRGNHAGGSGSGHSVGADNSDGGITLQPAALLDQWRDILRKAGLPKVQVRCAVMRTVDLLVAMGFNLAATSVNGSDGSDPLGEPIINNEQGNLMEAQIAHLARILGEAAL